jgi:uncharacterized membrane protein SpoIIM required for sporulation
MEFLKTDLQYALFCAFFVLMLGATLGALMGASSPEVTQAAQTQYSQSVVNQTYTKVEEKIEHKEVSLWMGVGLLMSVFVINNLAVATLIMFLPYYFKNWIGTLTTSYLLFITGLIPGVIFAQVAEIRGAAALSAFVPHGIFEFAAIVIAGGAAYYYLFTGARDERKPYIKSVYLKYVVPLIIIAALVELFITPVVMYMV